MVVKRILSVAFLLFLIVGSWLILSSSKYYVSEGKVFGTYYHVKYRYTSDLSKEIIEELNRVDGALSIFNDTSTITLFNQNRPFQSNELFEEVINTSRKVSAETNGAFDITVAPLVNAWGFGYKRRENLSQLQVDSLLKFVGYKKLIYDVPLRKTDKRIMLDCGSIAKGYGVDRVALLLSNKGIKDFMVEIGGEVVVRGNNPDGKKWVIGINKPIEDSTDVHQELQTLLQLRNKAVATSGNYRNFYYKNDKRYAHTISPHTGYPVEHSLLSATVIATNCTLADAYATSFMVMGLEAAKKFLSEHHELDAYLICSDNQGVLQTWQTPGMSELVKNE